MTRVAVNFLRRHPMGRMTKTLLAREKWEIPRGVCAKKNERHHTSDTTESNIWDGRHRYPMIMKVKQSEI